MIHPLNASYDQASLQSANGFAGTRLREFIWGAYFPEPVVLIDHTDAGDAAAGTPEVLHYPYNARGSVVDGCDLAARCVYNTSVMSIASNDRRTTIYRRAAGLAAWAAEVVATLLLVASMWGVWLETPGWSLGVLFGTMNIVNKNPEVAPPPEELVVIAPDIVTRPVRLFDSVYLQAGVGASFELEWEFALERGSKATVLSFPILLPMLLLLPCILLPLMRRARRAKRRSRGQCEACGYQLLLGQPQCPECGAQIDWPPIYENRDSNQDRNGAAD